MQAGILCLVRLACHLTDISAVDANYFTNMFVVCVNKTVLVDGRT